MCLTILLVLFVPHTYALSKHMEGKSTIEDREIYYAPDGRQYNIRVCREYGMEFPDYSERNKTLADICKRLEETGYINVIALHKVASHVRSAIYEINGVEETTRKKVRAKYLLPIMHCLVEAYKNRMRYTEGALETHFNLLEKEGKNEESSEAVRSAMKLISGYGSDLKLAVKQKEQIESFLDTLQDNNSNNAGAEDKRTVHFLELLDETASP